MLRTHVKEKIMKCKNCGYELPKTRNEDTCRICRRIKFWKDKDNESKEMQKLFTRRIVNELQRLNIIPEEEDIDTILSGKGLFIYGIAGSGKTLYACSLAFEFLRRSYIFPEYPSGRQITFTNVPNLLEEIRASFNISKKYEEGQQEEQKTTKEILDYYSSTDILILDDLGTERSTEWTLQILQILINNRYENILPTIITSNLGLKALSEQLDDRISSRIYEMCSVKNLGKEDHRLKYS
jgi:DNA replication protein DnaC